MAVDLSIRLDADRGSRFDRELASWYSDLLARAGPDAADGAVRDALATGFCVCHYGLAERYKTQLRADVEDAERNGRRATVLDEDVRRLQRELRDARERGERLAKDAAADAAAAARRAADDRVHAAETRASALETKLAAADADAREAVLRALEVKDAELRMCKQRADDAAGALERMHSDAIEREHARVVDALHREIEVLKNSNHCKGAVGEATIERALRAAFPTYEVRATHAIARSGDLHLVAPDGAYLLVECKAKQSIDRSDIEKFNRDVAIARSNETAAAADGAAEARERCVGGLFVSLLTSSIPLKGPVCLEREHGVPVLFVGFDDGAAAERDAPMFARVVMQLASAAAIAPESDVDSRVPPELDVDHDMMNAHLTTLMRVRTALEEEVRALEALATKKRAQCTTIGTMIDATQRLLGSRGALKISQQPGMYTCERCSMFASTTKKGMQAHMRTCGKT
jgi:hypothetical protein